MPAMQDLEGWRRPSVLLLRQGPAQRIAPFSSTCLCLQVIFHLQTRSPAVLPPLCELFGAGPGDERPMQEQRFPDWRLLQVGGAWRGALCLLCFSRRALNVLTCL